MNLQGKQSEKQQLQYQIALAFSNATSPQSFYTTLNKQGITLYERGGKITGIVGEKRKYRLKTLGYSQERIQTLDTTHTRLQALEYLKQNQKDRNQDIDRYQ